MANRNRRRCYVCDDLFNVQQLSRISGDENAEKRNIAILRRAAFGRPPLDVTELTRICINCNRSIVRELDDLQRDPNCLRLNVLYQTRNATCVICNSDVDVKRVSLECRVNVFVLQNIYMPSDVRSCAHHLDDRSFFQRHLLPNLRSINRPYALQGQELQLFLAALRENAKSQLRFNDENDFTEEEFASFSPVSKEQFQDLYTFCDPVPRESGHRYVDKRDLLCFLCKMHQGLSDEFLKVIFGYSSRQVTSLVISTVRQSLMQRFVPANIGVGSITREEFIEQHVNEFSNELYNPDPRVPRAIVYVDGTYTYIPKSSNFRFLRQSFSTHKGRHLLKPVLVVAPDGYILDIHGPYFSDSRNNDAQILRNEFDRDAESLRQWIEEGDIFVVDRGYRDVTELLQRLGIQYQMPALLARGQRQLPTEEANQSRLVTKTRWIVEARNGHIKSIFKFLNQVLQVTHLRNLGDFYRIAGAIINKYRPTINMEDCTAETARILLEKAKEPNTVQARVEVENLHTRNAQRWVTLSANHIQDFPVVTPDQLKDITVGIYQVNLAPSYVQDKFDREQTDEFQVEMLRNEDRLPEAGFLRVRIYSRHRNATKYQLWIAYKSLDEDEDENDDHDSPVIGYYCTCPSGARTLGTCAHISSVIWFLGFARHNGMVRYPSTVLLNTILDAANRPRPIDRPVNVEYPDIG